MEIVCFSASVRQCNIIVSVNVHVQVCFKPFLFIYYYISFLLARVAASSVSRICASGWLVGMETDNKGTANTSYYV